MSENRAFEQIDRAAWPREPLFRFFRDFDRPHYAITSRLDVTQMVQRSKSEALSAHRACLHAIGTGVHAVPEMRQRFRGDDLRQYDTVLLSITVPDENGSFGFAEFPYLPDFAAFDASTAALDAASRAGALGTVDIERDDIIYMSCTPWLDYTALTNPIRRREDCVPRICWGKFTETAEGRWDMAMTMEVHHALIDGAHIAACFKAVQSALNAF